MNTAFLLLSPDCILSGKAVGVLKELNNNNLQIARWRWHQLTLSEVDLLYRPNRDKREHSKIDVLVDNLFLSGESLCCLVFDATNPTPSSLHEKILLLKGPSNPFHCKPSQIRRAYGATNIVLNLIHTSDTPLDSERESSIFFPSFNINKETFFPRLIHEAHKRNMRVSPSGFRVANTIKQELLAKSEIAATSYLSKLRNAINNELSILESSVDQIAIYPQLVLNLKLQKSLIPFLELSENDRNILSWLIDICGERTARYSKNINSLSSVTIDNIFSTSVISVSSWDKLVMDSQEVSQ